MTEEKPKNRKKHNYFDKRQFEIDLTEYRLAPTVARLEHLTVTYLMPTAERYSGLSWIKFHDRDERLDATQIATLRCVRALDHFVVGKGSPLAYFDRICQREFYIFTAAERLRRARFISIDG
ncbi:MAG: hypothetical protein WCK47_13700 [bacterium]